MSSIFAAFASKSKLEIIAVFTCPQDTSVWEFQDKIEKGDKRWSNYIASLPPLVAKTIQEGFL